VRENRECCNIWAIRGLSRSRPEWVVTRKIHHLAMVDR